MTHKAKRIPLAEQEKATLSAAEQRQLDALKDIAFGTWFDFVREDGGRDMKLAWYSRVTSNYMFVNTAGIKQAVMTCVELVKGMQAGTIELVVLEKRSFMERAFGAVLNKLKPKATATTA